VIVKATRLVVAAATFVARKVASVVPKVFTRPCVTGGQAEISDVTDLVAFPYAVSAGSASGSVDLALDATNLPSGKSVVFAVVSGCESVAVTLFSGFGDTVTTNRRQCCLNRRELGCYGGGLGVQGIHPTHRLTTGTQQKNRTDQDCRFHCFAPFLVGRLGHISTIAERFTGVNTKMVVKPI